MITEPAQLPALLLDVTKREKHGFRVRVLLALSSRLTVRMGQSEYRDRNKIDSLIIPLWKRIAAAQRWHFQQAADER